MAKWMRELDLSDVWDKPESGELEINELAKIAADRLEKMEPIHSARIDFTGSRSELLEQFRILADYPDAGADDFDAIMRQLYD